tara:strand:- start:2103 stop:2810 length:708 start_codon:yes stop_codon:yes gene_type:complete
MIFLFIPPGTVLGPITGGSKFLKRPILNYIIRSYVFNIFYKISILILNIRKKKLLFSTNLLKDKINKKNKNHFFNYVLKDLKISKYKNKKKYDLIFYLRKHNNKNTNLQITLAKELAKKFKIITVGEKIYHHNIKNIGYATRFKLLKYIKETKFSFLSPENLYSLFAIDCISSKTNIFFQKHSLYKSKIISGVIYLNYKNVENLLKNIEKNIKEINSFRIKINSDKVKFKNYFKL